MSVYKLLKGGVLEETNWVYDEEKEEGSYVSKITDRPPISLIYEQLTLGGGITLRDVFLLVKNNPDLYPLIHNWVEEYIEEGLKNPVKETFDIEKEYVELYSYIETTVGEKERVCHLPSFADFHMMHKEEKDDESGTGIKKGEWQAYSVTFTPINEIIDHRLLLNTKLEWHSLDDDHKVIDMGNITYTLGQIVYGIFWEISFHGAPSTRDGRKEDLDEIVKDVQSRITTTEPFGDIDDI